MSAGLRVTHASAEVLRLANVGLRATACSAEVLRSVVMGLRATACSAEVLRSSCQGLRATACSAEVLRLAIQGLRATACSAEVLREHNTGLRVTGCSAEVLVSGSGALRVTACSSEILRTSNLGLMTTACSAEVLRSSSVGLRATACSAEILRASNEGLRTTACSAEVLRLASLGLRVTACSSEVLVSGIWPARVTQAVVEVMRLFEGSGIVTQAVVEALRTFGTEPEEPEPETELRIWPFPANAAHELTESYGYLGKILRSRSGVEQRLQLRATPGGEVAFTCTLLTVAELQLATVLLGTLIGQPIGVPLWQYKTALATDVSAYDTTVPADTSGVPWYPAGLALLWSSPWEYELFEILSVGSGSLMVNGGVKNSWPARRTFLLPVVVGYLEEREEFLRHTLRAGDFPFRFEVPAYFP